MKNRPPLQRLQSAWSSIIQSISSFSLLIRLYLRSKPQFYSPAPVISKPLSASIKVLDLKTVVHMCVQEKTNIIKHQNKNICLGFIFFFVSLLKVCFQKQSICNICVRSTASLPNSSPLHDINWMSSIMRSEDPFKHIILFEWFHWI